MLKKFGIGWDLLDSVKKRHIQFDLIKYLKYFLHVHVLIIVPKPIGKGCYRLVNFIRHLGSGLAGARSMGAGFFCS